MTLFHVNFQILNHPAFFLLVFHTVGLKRSNRYRKSMKMESYRLSVASRLVAGCFVINKKLLQKQLLPLKKYEGKLLFWLLFASLLVAGKAKSANQIKLKKGQKVKSQSVMFRAPTLLLGVFHFVVIKLFCFGSSIWCAASTLSLGILLSGPEPRVQLLYACAFFFSTLLLALLTAKYSG